MRYDQTGWFSRSITNIVLAFWALIVVFPLGWLIVSSFKTNQEILTSPWSLPEVLQWDNYVQAWTEASIGQYFWNTLVVIIPAIFFTLLFASMTAYALARFSFPGNRFLFYFLLAGMIFPVFLALVPLFFLLRDFQIKDTFPGLILVYIAYSLPFTVFLMTGFFRTIPSEFHEAAIIDGANQYQVFFLIMLPLAKSGLISLGIINFLGFWNQYTLPLILMNNKDNFVLSQGLAILSTELGFAGEYGILFAAITLVMIPTLLIYIIFQGQIQKGLTAGGLKG